MTDSLIQQMLDPGFYSHSVKEPIELMQTHVSYIFLTGDYAYKVKKPMNFGFLNYSTLELRKHFCEEEIRLNQRGAGEIYLEVLSVVQDGNKFAFGEEGEVVEYVLKMRQFPQETLLLNLFDEGKVTEALMEHLGRDVAQFHRKSETNEYIRSFGEVSQIREAFDENYEQTVSYIGKVQTQKQFDETQKFTENFFEEQRELFKSRMQNNWIRECHGDLHLRNICLWNDKILLFDCIEFNEPFRFVDVMFDIAYAVMELEGRSRSNLSNAYLNTYVEEMGDWEGLLVLPIYLNRQSYVRAKVTSFLLDDPTVPDTTKQEAAKTAAQYYKMAWEYAQPRQGKLMMMSGLSGSGKTTVGRYLARKHSAIQIRSDAVRKHLAGVPLNQSGGAELYTSEMSEKTYQHLLELGTKLASQGWNVILDGKYDRQMLREDVINSAKTHNLPLQIFHCTASVEICQERIYTRRGDVSDATPELLPKQFEAAEPFSELEQPYVITVDTMQADWKARL